MDPTTSHKIPSTISVLMSTDVDDTSESGVVTRSLTLESNNLQRSLSSLTDGNDTVSDNLNKALLYIAELEAKLKAQDKDGGLLNSAKEIVALKSKNETLANQNQLYEEIIEVEKGNVSKKKRVKQTLNNNKLYCRSIRDVMTTKVLPKLKFASDKEMQTLEKGSVGYTVLTALAIDLDEWPQTWATFRLIASRVLVEHRGRVTQAVKTLFLQELLKKAQGKCDEFVLPLVTKLQEAENDTNILELIHSTDCIYASFFRIFARGILPHKKIKTLISGSTSEFNSTFTAQDEALLIVILDNNLIRWRDEFHKKLDNVQGNLDAFPNAKLSKKDKQDLPQPKYTMVKLGSSNLRGTWDDQGFGKFLDILEVITEFRTDEAMLRYRNKAIECYDAEQVRLANKRKQEIAADEYVNKHVDQYEERMNKYMKSYVQL